MSIRPLPFLLIALLFKPFVFADQPPVIIQEQDGSPRGVVTKLRVNNGTLTKTGTTFDFLISSSTLPSDSTNYIQNTNSLQTGSTFYVSSGTVLGGLTVGTITATGQILGDITSVTLTDGLTGGGTSGDISIGINFSSVVSVQNAIINKGVFQSGAQFNISSGTIATELNISSTVVFREGAAMGTPASGKVVTYAKTNGLIYSKDDAGQEDLMSGAQVFGGTFTRDMSLASGNQSITGVGFKPKAVFGITAGTTGGRDQASLGGAMTGSANYCMEIGGATGIVYPQPTVAGIWRTAAAGGNYQTFVLSSFDSDGFTIAWTKVGTPTGTATVTYFAIR